MTGIIKENDGSYSYRIKKVLPDGRRVDTKKKGFPSMRAAKAARDERLLELSGACPARLRYDELFSRFFSQEAQGNRKYSTLLRYQSLHKNHISPAFGPRFADAITPAEISRFLRDKRLSGLSSAYVASIYKQLGVVFSFALRGRLLSSNPMEQASLPRKDISEAHQQQQRVKVLSEAEFQQLCSRLRGSTALTPMLLGYYMGLRVSEAYAVRWRDIDWHNNTLRVDKQLQYQDHLWCLVPPKSFRGYRVLSMPQALASYLQAELAAQKQRKRTYGKAYRKSSVLLRLTPRQDEPCLVDDFICVKRNGEFLTPASAKQITLAARSIGLTHYRFHHLRHTHASMLANRNVSAVLLTERLGHEKIGTAWTFYSHANQQARDGMRQALDQMPSST